MHLNWLGSPALNFRISAALTHFFFGALLFALPILALICLWFPQNLFFALNIHILLGLLLLVDLTLGPILTACVFTQNKSQRHRWLDESFVLLIQLAGLGYGLHTLYQARPVYIVWHSQQWHVVQAKDLTPDNLAETEPTFQPKLTGPQWVTAIWPAIEQRRGNPLAYAVAEKRHYFPQYFAPAYNARSEIRLALQKTQADLGALKYLPAELNESPLWLEVFMTEEGLMRFGKFLRPSI